MSEENKECYVCYRVERLSFYTNAFDLHKDERTARFWAEYSAQLLKRAYHADFRSVCGRSSKTLVSGCLRLSSILLDIYIPQKYIAEVVGVTEISTRVITRVLSNVLNIDFKRLADIHRVKTSQHKKGFYGYHDLQ